MARSHLHASRRVGVGSHTVAASRPFSRRFLDSLDRSIHTSRRHPAAAHLTVRLGDLDQFRAVLLALHFPPVTRA